MLRIGIDLGGTNIVAGVVNDKYEIKPYNIKGSIDFRDKEWTDIDPDEYKVTVEDEKNKEGSQMQKLTATSKIMLGIIFFVLFVVGAKKIIAYKKKERNENG